MSSVPLNMAYQRRCGSSSGCVAHEHGTVTIPQLTWQVYERDFADRHLLHAVVAKWD